MKLKGLSTPSRNIAVGLVLAAFLAASQPGWAQRKEAAPKVYRWVDENGEVHYSETLPPDWKQETHDELDARGIVREEGVSRLPPPPKPTAEVDPTTGKAELPRDKSGLKRPDPLYTDAEKQQQLDRMLLLRYHSEDEILEAMDVEIEQLQYDAQLLNTTRASLEASLKRNITVAGDRQRAGLDVSEEMLASITDIRARLESNDRSLNNLRVREQQIRDEFGRSVERYRELSEKYAEEES